MTAWMIIGGILLFFLLLAQLRVGVIVDFGDTLCVRMRIGPIRRTLLPEKSGRKKAETEEKAAEPSGEKKEKPKLTDRLSLPKLTFAELRDLMGTVLRALGRTLRTTCRRTRIDPLEVGVIFAGADPADVAQTYGWANAVLWSFMPQLERLFTIPRPSIYLGMDFEKQETSVEGTVGVSLRVGDLLAIALTLALPVGKWFLRYRREHREPPAETKPQETAETLRTDETEKQTA